MKYFLTEVLNALEINAFYKINHSDGKRFFKTDLSDFCWFSVILTEIIYFPKIFSYSHIWNKFQHQHWFRVKKLFKLTFCQIGNNQDTNESKLDI